jgi:hypothetical protein
VWAVVRQLPVGCIIQHDAISGADASNVALNGDTDREVRILRNGFGERAFLFFLRGATQPRCIRYRRSCSGNASTATESAENP